MEMELRSGRRLRSAAQGAAAPVRRRCRARRRSPSPERDGGGESRLSDLPDALLLLILSGLGSTAEAPRRTCTLSPRFATLWPELPVLIFRSINPGTIGDLLARACHPNLTRLEIQIPRQDSEIPASQVTSLLRAAHEHHPEELVFDVPGGSDGDLLLGTLPPHSDRAFELPCFARAVSMELRIWKRIFTLPPAGEFTRLKNLTLSLCRVNPSSFLHRFPCLRKLHMECYWDLHEVISIKSETLEEVMLNDFPLAVARGNARHVEIVAPLLSKFSLVSCGNRALIMNKFLNSNNVESLSFKYCSISSCSVGCGIWRFKSLVMETEKSTDEFGQIHLVRVLSVVIIANDDRHYARPSRSFTEEIACLPVNDFTVLKLELARVVGFGTGSLVLHLLQNLNVIQRLHLVISQNMKPCVLGGAHIRVDEDISLTKLEEVEIEGFSATSHYLNFLKLLFKSAPVLQIMRIQLSSGDSQTHKGYNELCRILREKRSVRCYCNLVKGFVVDLELKGERNSRHEHMQ